MTDTGRRSSSLPHPRATALLARTIYRELRRASYEQQDVARFIGELMELMTANVGRKDDPVRPVAGVLDPETGLSNRTTLEQILDFEIRRADEATGAPMLLLCVDVEVPDSCPDDLVRKVHERTAAALRRRLREHDVVARVPPNRYLVLVPNAETGLVLELCARFGDELHGGAHGQPALPAGTRYTVRWVVRSEAVGSGADLLEQITRAPGIPLGIVEEERPLSVNTDGLASSRRRTSSRPKPARRVVLALGGGAVRAGAHVGVMDVLAESGVEVCGVAGTSAGALVGAMLLTGLSHDEIIQRFESFTTTSLYEQIRSLYAGYMRRANRSRHVDTYFRQSDLSFMSDSEISAVPDELYAEFIEYFVGPDRDISTLRSPFSAYATDIVAGRPAYFMRGPLHQALRASCAVPGLFAPQADGERLLVDGSTVTEVPVEAATGLRVGAPVLAVYLERPTPKVARFSTSAEVLTRTAALVRTELVREQLRSTALLLTVPVRDGGWLGLRKANETRNVGEVVARMALEGLLSDLDRATAATSPDVTSS